MKRALLTSLYNGAGLAAMAAAALPVLLSPRWRSGLGQRLALAGSLPDPAGGGCTWIHGSSVGEVLAAAGLVEGLLQRRPSARVVFSTFTVSGRETARERFGDRAACSLAPLDWDGIPARFVRLYRPSLFLLLETELWPNLLAALQRGGCPAVLVNGRLSERSFPRYRALKWFFRPYLETLRLLCVRTEEDGERFRLLGAPAERIRITGNIKYDRRRESGAGEATAELARKALGEGRGGLVVAGSLRGRECAVIPEVFATLRARFPGLRLVAAPRHPGRFDSSLLDRAGLTWVRWSGLKRGGEAGGAAVILVDTVGDLPHLYGLADVAFVGGTLDGTEGHNLLEPASQGVPVLFGPGFRNFEDEGRALLAGGGGFVTGSPEALAERAADLLVDGEARKEAGRRAREVAEGFAGALERTLQAVEGVMAEGAR